MTNSGTFSEHWHRVAHQRLSLRASVQTRKQLYRGEKWHLILDPLNNQFFRVPPGAYDFLCRLDRGATVQEVWKQSLERDPNGAPGQEEVIQLLSQLHQANLLSGELPPDSARLLERQQRRRRREFRAWLNPMFLRFPLLDPDRFLLAALPFVRWLFSPLGIALWLGVVGLALKVALEHAPALRDESEGVLALENLPLLYASMVLIKVLHEFGHAFACRSFGGEVHQMGVMFMYFSPVPYVDATSSWAFRSKWRRLAVASAGMVAELFVAALAVFIWASTGEGTLHSLAYNMMWIASVTTILFNANPLLRYDGYYILSDWLEMPNLQGRSILMLQYLGEHYLLGVRGGENPARRVGEGIWLAVYGVVSWLYRVFLFGRIALFIGTRYLLLGVLAALGCVFSFTVAPLWTLFRYLAASPRLGHRRGRAGQLVGGAAALLLSVLAWWPMPHRFRAPGVLRADEFSQVFTDVAGTVTQLLAPSGTIMKKGAALLRLASPELEFELAGARAQQERATAELERAMSQGAAEISSAQSRLEVARKRVRRLEEQESALVLRAPQDGTWVCPHLAERVGQWFSRGQPVGEMVQEARFRFTAVIPQEDASDLFGNKMRGSEVRLAGQAGITLPVEKVRVLPAEQDVLPSPALGWMGGGEVAVSRRDPAGTHAAVPFFELRAVIVPQPGVKLLHGTSGKIRVELKPEPLLTQWWRRLRQLLQERYQV